MAVLEVVRSRRACAERPAVVNPLPQKRFLWCCRVHGWPFRGGNVTFPVDQYFQPLCPLENPDDKSRYLDIDSYEEMFKKFKDAFDDPGDWNASSHVIVVTGDRGYGKTSLIQRCAHWLRVEKPQQACNVVVLDLSGERWPVETGDERIKRTFGRIINKLKSYLPKETISELIGHSHDINDSFYYLGQALKAKVSATHGALPIALVVLLPSYSTASEVARYYNLACPGTFFFAEIFEVEDTRKVRDEISKLSRSRADFLPLAMSVLKVGDANKIANWIRNERPGNPVLPNKIVQERFDSLIDGRKISISELNRLAWGVLRFAAKEAADQVTDRHFAQYYEEIIYPGFA
jgi:hypothetical protein